MNITYIKKEDLKEHINSNHYELGHTFFTKDNITNEHYVYFYKPNDENPYWIKIDLKTYWKKQLNKLTLEEKVDFLLNKYIDYWMEDGMYEKRFN